MKEVFHGWSGKISSTINQDPLGAVMTPIWRQVRSRVQDQVHKRTWEQVETDMDSQVWEQVREELL